MRWSGHPNLRHRPHSPSLGRGRLQRQIARAFAVSGPVVSASVIYDWCFARRPKMRRSHLNRRRVWQLLTQIADPVRKVPPYGAWLWRLRSDDTPTR
jgi:hypothetical protein